MNERILELQIQAEAAADEIFDRKGKMYGEIVMEKFAELIVAECTAVLFDKSERLSELYSEEENMSLAEEYEIRSNQCIDDIALIEKHFGVEE
jgi:hypothetical protein